MIGGIIQSLFGGKPQATPVGARHQASPFDALDRYQRGLAGRVRHYIMSGDDPSFPTELSQILAHAGQGGGYSYVGDCKRLAHAFGGNPDGLVRLIRIHAALGCTSPRSLHKHQAAIPDGPTRLFYIFKDNALPEGLEVPTTMDDVSTAVRALGGSDVDIVTVMLPTGRFQWFPNVSDLRDHKSIQSYRDRIEADVLISALDRCDAKCRTYSIEKFRAKAAEEDPAFLEYLFRQFDESSEKLRDAVHARMANYEPATVEKMALERLDSGKSAMRAAMVRILGELGTPSALAAIEARRAVETTPSVVQAIDTFLATSQPEAAAVSENGYVDVFGDEIHAPDRGEPVDDGASPLGAEFLAEMETLETLVRQGEAAEHERKLAGWKKYGKNGDAPQKPSPPQFARDWMDLLNAPIDLKDAKRAPAVPWRYREQIDAAIESALTRLPKRRVIDLAVKQAADVRTLLSAQSFPAASQLGEFLQNGDIGLSQVMRYAAERGMPVRGNIYHQAEPDPTPLTESYVRTLVGKQERYRNRPQLFADVWEVAMRHLDVIMDALPPRTNDVDIITAALKLAATFPTLPQALLHPVLMAAIDENPKLQKPAQALLMDAPGIDDMLVTLIDDKKQGVRANAARFLARRQAKQAIPAIAKRLKKEKSEFARAELISAIATLEGDTQPYIGKDALLKEAKALVDKLPNAKIDWLDLNHAPALVWADGSTADKVLLDAWLRLALKLKSPTGSPLFDLYFGQLQPDSAAAVSEWVLDSWIGYDTHGASPAEIRILAEKRAKMAVSSGYNWLTHDQWVAQYTRQIAASYVNSAADSKGILALTHFAPPASAAPKIAAYLKKHGRRVSQAKALVETLFGMGSKDAVQVLVATATRFRQRSVRELAETLVGELAEARGWTEDALADRSVPTGGFEEDGLLPLPVGEDEKPYQAELGSDLTIRLFNPDGKEVKSLPAGKDENTKASKALLSAAKTAIKTVKAQQESRLYEAMLRPRVWDIEDWRNDLTTHPIFKRLIERLIWRGLDADGKPVNTLRLTPEGEILNAEGDDADMSSVEKLDLAHAANLSEADREAWRQHLKDFEVAPLFEQVTRPVRTLTEDQLKGFRLDDRQGWLMTTFKLRSAAKKCGYERGPIEDGGGFQVYRKSFHSVNLWADLYFTGSHVGEEDIDAAIDYMQFTRMENATHGRTIPLGKVPPLLLSEVWNDMHEIAKAGAFDPEWKKKGLY